MTVVRYEPWSLVNRFQRDIDRLFNAQQTTAADSGAWLPPVDINEEDNLAHCRHRISSFAFLVMPAPDRVSSSIR